MTGREDVFQQAMNQGHSAAWDQKWDQAAGFYRTALEEFPDNPNALTSLGLALFELREYPEALPYYLKAAKLSPEDPYLMEKIAQLYEHTGDIDRAQTAGLRAAELYLKSRDVNKAINNWSMVTRLNPENLRARSRLAVIYERLGKTDLAIKEYLNIAALFQRANDLEKSAQAVKHALVLRPGSPEARQAAALLRASQPIPLDSRTSEVETQSDMDNMLQLQAPEEDIQTEKGLDPVAEARQKALAVLAGMVFEGSDEHQYESDTKRGFQAIMRGAGSLLPDHVDQNRVKLHLSQVVDLQTRGEASQAAEELERAMGAGLDHAAAFFDLGLLRLQTERLESAMRNLQLAVQHSDYSLGARLLLGQTLLNMGRVGEASIEFMEGLRLADAEVVPQSQAHDLSQLYDPLIETQRQESDPKNQEQVCENISGMLMRPGWRSHLRQAREQLSSHSEGGPLIPLAEIMIQSRSSQFVESLSKISQLEDEGHLRSAMEEAYYALQFAPTYLPLHTYMGELLLQQDQLQEAIDKFLMVAQSYNMRGEAQRAVELYRHIIDLAPLDLSPRRFLIDQLLAQGQVEDALNEHMDYADIYYRMADLDNARETYMEALNLAQQSQLGTSWRVKILHRIADIDLQSLDWRQALQIYETIRSLQPDDEKARRNLVELNIRLGLEDKAQGEIDNYLAYLKQTNQQESVIEFLENLVREVPDRPALHNRLAQYYYNAGRTTDAIAQLDTVGELFVEAGDTAGAIQAFEAILALNPPNKGDYQERLDRLRL
ncbi:MAG: tetratricopeptide repeat protein [Anaerolineales bacterium]|nr:tetratricopeptide repeat protein [Anaerolineales bacterium]